MLRTIIKVLVGAIVGYAFGLLFGYRAAVVDYVENDAQTIESMADSMYGVDQGELFENLPVDVEELAESDAEEDDGRGFQ